MHGVIELNIHHIGTRPIKTSRLTLRPFVIEDAQAMYENWASDSEVTRFLRWPPHTDVTVSQTVLSAWMAEYEKPDFYQWAIVPDDFGAPIGTIGVNFCDDMLGLAHIGYAIGRPFWNRGYTTEALSAVISYLFAYVGMNRIESQHDPDNGASGAVMKKCGMKYEGTHRQADYSNRGIVDACMYAILRIEWEQTKNENQENSYEKPKENQL